MCLLLSFCLSCFLLLRFVFVDGRTCVRSRKAVLHALLSVCFVSEPLVFFVFVGGGFKLKLKDEAPLTSHNIIYKDRGRART